MGDNRFINNIFLKIRIKIFKVLFYIYKVIYQNLLIFDILFMKLRVIKLIQSVGVEEV